jgi:hypothetical protein
MRPDEGCNRSQSVALGRNQSHSVALSRTRLHSVALGCTLRPSVGNQRPSVAISGNQRPSVAISGHQRPSAYLALSGSSAPRWAPYAQSSSQHRTWPRMLATRSAVPWAGPFWFTSTPASPDERFNQRSSVLIHPPSPHTVPSVAISAHQYSSVLIRLTQCHQWPSVLISAHSPHTVPAGSNDGRYSRHACTPSGRWRRLR